MPRLVAVGRVGRPHGVRGEVRVDLGSGTADGFERYGRLFLRGPSGEAAPARVEAWRPHGRLLLVKFSGVDTPEAARGLTNRDLCVDRAELPPLGPDEYYHGDLLDCSVVDEGGAELGLVADVFTTAAHDVLVIRSGAAEWMLPVTAECVPQMDLGARRLTVRVPEGLRG
jgi:16S rRNA processing protein RimM